MLYNLVNHDLVNHDLVNGGRICFMVENQN